MEARPVDRVLGLEALVEDAGDDLQKRAAQAGAARGACRECDAVASRASDGAIMLAIRSPGSSGAGEQVGLAEHAVQMQVEAGHEVARAEAEARREDAGVAVRVEGGDVRRAVLRRELVEQRADEGEGALRLAEAA